MDRFFGPSSTLGINNADSYISTPRLRINITTPNTLSSSSNLLPPPPPSVTSLSSSSSSSSSVPPSLYTTPKLIDYRNLLQTWVRTHPLQLLPAVHAKELSQKRTALSNNKDLFNEKTTSNDDDDEMAGDDDDKANGEEKLPPPSTSTVTNPIPQNPTGRTRLWGVVNKFATHAMSHPLLGIINEPLANGEEEGGSFGAQSTTHDDDDDDDDDGDEDMEENDASIGNDDEDDEDDGEGDDMEEEYDENMDDKNNKLTNRSSSSTTGNEVHPLRTTTAASKKKSLSNIYEYDLNDAFVDDTDLYRARQQARRAGKKLKITDFLLTTTSNLLKRSAVIEAKKNKCSYEEALDLVGYMSTEEEYDNEELISTTSSVLTPYELSSDSDTHGDIYNSSKNSNRHGGDGRTSGRGGGFNDDRRSHHQPRQAVSSSSRRHRRNKDNTSDSSSEEEDEDDRRNAKRRNKDGKTKYTVPSTENKPSTTDDATKKLLEFFLRKQLTSTLPSSDAGATGGTADGGTTEDGTAKENDGRGLVNELLQLITHSSSNTGASPNLTALQRKAQEEEKERLRKEKEKEASLRQEEKDVSSRERRQEFLEANKDKPLVLLASEQSLMDNYVKHVKSYNQHLIADYRSKRETTGFKVPMPEITFPTEYELELAQLDRVIRRRFKNQRPGPYMVKLMMIPGMPDTLTREKVLNVLKNANAHLDAYEAEQYLNYCVQNIQMHIKRRLDEVPNMSMTSYTNAQTMTEQALIEQDRALAVPETNPMIDTRSNNNILMDTTTVSEEQRIAYEAIVQNQPTNPADRLTAHGWFSLDNRLLLAIGIAFKAFTVWNKYETLYRNLVRGPGRRTTQGSSSSSTVNPDNTDPLHFLQRLIGIFPPENAITINGLKVIEAHYMLGHYNRYPTNGVMVVTVPASTILPPVILPHTNTPILPTKITPDTSPSVGTIPPSTTPARSSSSSLPTATTLIDSSTGNEVQRNSSSSSSSSTVKTVTYHGNAMENEEGEAGDDDDDGAHNLDHNLLMMNDEDNNVHNSSNHSNNNDDNEDDLPDGSTKSKGFLIIPRSLAARAFDPVTTDDFRWAKFFPPGGPTWLNNRTTTTTGTSITSTPSTKGTTAQTTNRTPLSSHAAQHAAAAASAGLRHPSLNSVNSTPSRMNEIVEIDG